MIQILELSHITFVIFCSVLDYWELMVLERHPHFVCSLETLGCPVEMLLLIPTGNNSYRTI